MGVTKILSTPLSRMLSSQRISSESVDSESEGSTTMMGYTAGGTQVEEIRERESSSCRAVGRVIAVSL